MKRLIGCRYHRLPYQEITKAAKSRAEAAEKTAEEAKAELERAKVAAACSVETAENDAAAARKEGNLHLMTMKLSLLNCFVVY
eukprot:scaffold224035_cov38-Prasinocladus_malaysianus.AAC.1